MQNPIRQLTCLAPLQGFEATARHLSFTLAAAELCLTQSAISRQVQALEEQLGVPLFVRGHRKLTLTPAGEAMLASIQEVFRTLTRTVESIRVGQRRPVTLSTTIGIAALWLVPRLSRFLAEHPEIDVRISANNRLVDIQREGIDLALRYVMADPPPPASHLLFGEDIFPVATAEVLGELAVRPARAEDIARLTLLNYDDSTPEPWLEWSIWLKKLDLADVQPKAVLHFNHYDQLIAAAVAGQGVALGRSVLLAEHLASRRLLPMACGYRHVSQRAYFLVAASGDPRPEVRLLSDWLRVEAFASQR
ncbi:LysR family transcriptional regulator [Zoogloea oryzae]|uniref:LysR family transcriptional regulator n=1 Tax=Zoogloea oryzae TaxID=310767 RepID=A0ABQ6FDD4_9RHOO|nr:LysR substrate-binding domain-containing protein [Zoogloea oryzae]GLT22591.1 LysR family transcriptional regulator [Zoogloea oryzae]